MTPAKRSDIEAIFDIERMSFQNPWRRESFLTELSCAQAHHGVVKELGAGNKLDLLAYIFTRALVDELYILKIAVAAEHRQCGIASWLLEAFLSQPSTHAFSTALLDVRPSNVAAIRLYEQNGFATVGIRPNYYTDTGENALVMRKLL